VLDDYDSNLPIPPCCSHAPLSFTQGHSQAPFNDPCQGRPTRDGPRAPRVRGRAPWGRERGPRGGPSGPSSFRRMGSSIMSLASIKRGPASRLVRPHGNTAVTAQYCVLGDSHSSAHYRMVLSLSSTVHDTVTVQHITVWHFTCSML